MLKIVGLLVFEASGRAVATFAVVNNELKVPLEVVEAVVVAVVEPSFDGLDVDTGSDRDVLILGIVDGIFERVGHVAVPESAEHFHGVFAELDIGR